MKTLFKILTILAVALVISGLLYGAVSAFSSSDAEQVSIPGRPANGELNRVERPNSTAGLQLPMDSVKNLLIISVVAAVYVNLSKWMNGRKSDTVRVRS